MKYEKPSNQEFTKKKYIKNQKTGFPPMPAEFFEDIDNVEYEKISIEQLIADFEDMSIKIMERTELPQVLSDHFTNYVIPIRKIVHQNRKLPSSSSLSCEPRSELIDNILNESGLFHDQILSRQQELDRINRVHSTRSKSKSKKEKQKLLSSSLNRKK